MFKVGDEVFIKAEITDVHPGSERPYFVQPCYDSVNWVSKNKLYRCDGNYEQGLADAWELVRKLGEIEQDEREKMFSYRSVKAIIEDCTIEEVMDKIEAYEKEKEIKVGDVVEYKNTLKAVVTRIENCDEVYVLWGDGSCGKLEKNQVLKNGKTAEGLTDLLRQIGE